MCRCTYSHSGRIFRQLEFQLDRRVTRSSSFVIEALGI